MIILRLRQQQQQKHRCPDRLSPWVHLHPQQQPRLPLSTALPTPSGALTVPSGGRGWFFGGRGEEGGRMPPGCAPHLPPTPLSPLQNLFMPPTPSSAPPWGRWQPSTVKGRGSHDGFHRWSVEIAGKDLSSVEQQRAESQREKYGWKREGWGDKERVRQEEGGEGGACLRRVVWQSAKSVFVGKSNELIVLQGKMCKVGQLPLFSERW